jgi:hypothetical protein
VKSRLLRSGAVATLAVTALAGPVAAQPDNSQTLHFVLACDDGNVWDASFNGGPSAFHLDGGRLFVWKELSFVTPTGESGSLSRGSNGFAAEPTVTCEYIGAESGNEYIVTGFYAR